MNSVLVGMFDTQTSAEQARTRLIAAGFSPGQVTGNVSGTGSVDESITARPEDEGGISGFFRSLFGSDDESNSHSGTYQEAFRRGGFGLTVSSVADTDMEHVSTIMEDCGAVDVDEREQQWRNEGWTGESSGKIGAQGVAGAVGTPVAAGETKTVNLVEENLAVGKRLVGKGGVRVFSRIVEVPVEETVRLREEHAEVQRRVVDRPATEADFAAFNEGTIEVRSTAEEAVVSKSARVVGEVEIGTQVTERDEVVRDTLRKTEVDVQQLDDTRAIGNTASVTGLSETPTSISDSANRDPITGTPGAHPVGTGVGALAGGAAAGAAVGTVAGPVGTAVGAVVGAVAGGLGGKGVAEELDPTVVPESKKPL